MFLIERIFAGLSRLAPLLAFPLILATVPALALTKEAAIADMIAAVVLVSAACGSSDDASDFVEAQPVAHKAPTPPGPP